MKTSREIANYHRVDELGGLEVLSARYEQQTFSRHTHAGYTLGVIDQGAQRFLRNGANHIAPQDSIILVNHDEVHDGHSASEGGWSYKAIYPLPEQLQLIRSEAGLSDTGSLYFREPVVHDPELAGLLRQALHSLQHSANRLERETLLYGALLKLMQRHGKERRALEEPAAARNRIELVRNFLHDQPAADISLQELANLAGINSCHLVRQFQRYYGLPPHAYQIQLRVRLAQRLIRSGHRLMDAALDAGFTDQSHLNRHFKKTLGVTPGQYARQQSH
ncbi:AraC family transcriptional regulator [Neptuniibacter halophilus]|uniref:AraC family transcriptional regulator n=1 Tax=Neptuniibacter halophilus TaxID=651666 RepID=UPI002573483C|nr:AraC family transcriptional regulator [Neptuniibacter halophilus]